MLPVCVGCSLQVISSASVAWWGRCRQCGIEVLSSDLLWHAFWRKITAIYSQRRSAVFSTVLQYRVHERETAELTIDSLFGGAYSIVIVQKIWLRYRSCSAGVYLSHFIGCDTVPCSLSIRWGKCVNTNHYETPYDTLWIILPGTRHSSLRPSCALRLLFSALAHSPLRPHTSCCGPLYCRRAL